MSTNANNKRPRRDASSDYLAPPQHGGGHASDSDFDDGATTASAASASRAKPSASKKAKTSKAAPASASMKRTASKEASGSSRSEYISAMSTFWEDQLALDADMKPVLPLARIKKIIKNDEDVRSSVMISGEAPFLLSRACELFTLDLTMRAWAHTDSTNRRTLQRSDVADAIAATESFDFLLDIVPRDETQQSALQITSTTSLLTAFQNKPNSTNTPSASSSSAAAAATSSSQSDASHQPNHPSPSQLQHQQLQQQQHQAHQQMQHARQQQQHAASPQHQQMYASPQNVTYTTTPQQHMMMYASPPMQTMQPPPQVYYTTQPAQYALPPGSYQQQ